MRMPSIKVGVYSQRTDVFISHEEEAMLMQQAEMEQTKHDTFWGKDKQNADIQKEKQLLYNEDCRSLQLELFHKMNELKLVWLADEARFRKEDAYATAVAEEYERSKYIQLIHTAQSSAELINYRWPTKPFVLPQVI